MLFEPRAINLPTRAPFEYHDKCFIERDNDRVPMTGKKLVEDGNGNTLSRHRCVCTTNEQNFWSTHVDRVDKPSKLAAKPGPAIWTYFKGCGPFDKEGASATGSNERRIRVPCTAEPDPTNGESNYYLPARLLDDIDTPPFCRPIGYEQNQLLHQKKPATLPNPRQIFTRQVAAWVVDTAFHLQQQNEGSSYDFPPDEDSPGSVFDDDLDSRLPNEGFEGWDHLHVETPEELDMSQLNGREMVDPDVAESKHIVIVDDDSGSEAVRSEQEPQDHQEIPQKEKEVLVGHDS